MATELLRTTVVNILHVPYKGAGLAMPDLLSRGTSLACVLAVTGSARIPELRKCLPLRIPCRVTW